VCFGSFCGKILFTVLPKSERFYTPVTWAAPKEGGQKGQLPSVPLPPPPLRKNFDGDLLVLSRQLCQYATY